MTLFSQWPRRAAVLLAATAVAHPALASLGAGRDSIEADRAHLAATLSSTAAATHTIHALTTPSGVAREYARADGTVFAISWRGPARPDLRQLLGSYFDAFQTDNALRGGRRSRRPLSVNRTDLVVRSGGHSGAFWGTAYLPRLAPAGFSSSDWR
jgi:hypothetical protein